MLTNTASMCVGVSSKFETGNCSATFILTSDWLTVSFIARKL